MVFLFVFNMFIALESIEQNEKLTYEQFEIIEKSIIIR